MMLGDPDVEFRDDEGKGKRLHTFHTCDPHPTSTSNRAMFCAPKRHRGVQNVNTKQSMKSFVGGQAVQDVQ